ncbi:MAG: orotidine-5'-phosphate decarboxylase [Archaeoglobales archaeon]|nr:orotidine-5'-phosphate decarboxylase [Archaeoglobales archaeon]
MKKLILALDIQNVELALKIAKNVAEFIDFLKINYPLTLSAGVGILKDLAKIRPTIADFKIADIPYTSSMIAETAFENNASAVITHGFVGSDTVKAVLDVAKKYGGEVYVVSELSSPGGEEFMAKHSIEIVEMAKKIGCHGIIAPSTRMEKVRKIREVAVGMKVFCPGVGVQGGDIEVLKYCDGIIVGRSIYLAKDPREEAKKIRKIVDSF